MKFKIAILFSLLLIALTTADETVAQCSCSKPNITALEEYADAAVVFTGEIIDVQNSKPDEKRRYIETTTIRVDHAWKENLNSIFTIKNYVDGCLQGWKPGEKYLVYAYLSKDTKTYWTGCCCSRTGSIKERQSDVDAFFDAGLARTNVRTSSTEKVVSAGWMNSRATNFRQPPYPADIKKPRPAAKVDVKILTDVEGNVITADVIRGPVRFHEAALAAARNLKFPPISLSGVPTKVSGWVSFDFKP